MSDLSGFEVSLLKELRGCCEVTRRRISGNIVCLTEGFEVPLLKEVKSEHKLWFWIAVDGSCKVFHFQSHAHSLRTTLTISKRTPDPSFIIYVGTGK